MTFLKWVVANTGVFLTSASAAVSFKTHTTLASCSKFSGGYRNSVTRGTYSIKAVVSVGGGIYGLSTKLLLNYNAVKGGMGTALPPFTMRQ